MLVFRISLLSVILAALAIAHAEVRRPEPLAKPIIRPYDPLP